ncbi:flagellar biosynthesis protein FlhB [Acetobacterium wieringae]|uniref:Flagellar biosynthetic protein FlhB n=1 Tax=Acetobacterium wieringae TaxID=52694 RepID=A0A1F2PH02_9FIRM|nr:flagellar biosynthesis protein FlhB [Acetobacterium wieringae]MEA4804400.1 flagellar biosynthesis protein FlhB [Acetobacterium wieringae]OFV69996.1 flagellar biosynthetic protein FlhB [Acetobacterium wieringae]UYO63813.1 flagellar biosynthesis protein FlhB [Acetobacterium wieringae]VUZ27297.1 Flagellar biosynthetic protein FlhB [Acetobacterium wieringae]
MAGSEKTEKATPKKRKDERKKGNTFQSKDVVSVVLLFVAFFILNLLVPFIYQQIKNLYIAQMKKMTTMETLTVSGVNQLFREGALVFFISVLPVAIVIMFVAVIMSGVQTGFLVTGDALKPKFNRINPLSGIKRMFSLRSLVELLKSLAKVALIIAIIYTTILAMIPMTPDMLITKIDENVMFMMDQTMSMVQTVCMIFAVVAILDYAYQRYDYEKKLKMTKQEVKDEYKQTEGNPEIKGKIRQKQREMSMSRMMQMVPQADVIVRNPTHFAVALKYDADQDVAPLVLAKGKDHIALRIVKVAEENKVLVKENKGLARSLYESVEINAYIPAELYKAVAELMAWVYSTRKKENVK